MKQFIINFLIILALALFTAFASWICDKPKPQGLNDFQIKQQTYKRLTFNKYCMIKQASTVARIDENAEFRKIDAESGFSGSAVSCKGALGEAQLMPGTAAYYPFCAPWKSYDNILAGALEYRACLSRAKGNEYSAFCKYNSGKNRTEYPAESHRYAAKCTGMMTVAMR